MQIETPVFLREAIMLLLVIASLGTTRATIRVANRFDYVAIGEVGALFIGIFICMQVPIEILNLKGASLGIDTPAKFFWATGLLSSFLDNAPTYVVFFETAAALPNLSGALEIALTEGRAIISDYLIPISLGAVFMGANTYIGNGPNFMVKSIAEQAGVKMPSFFGYMVYSSLILLPIFALVTLVLI
jgi:Na+/H+ antiporter NhaD/arsenite permease-like protein